MESSIAEFLLRRLACELLPTMYANIRSFFETYLIHWGKTKQSCKPDIVGHINDTPLATFSDVKAAATGAPSLG